MVSEVLVIFRILCVLSCHEQALAFLTVCFWIVTAGRANPAGTLGLSVLVPDRKIGGAGAAGAGEVGAQSLK